MITRFVRSMLCFKERVRLLRTLQQPVEDNLLMKLRKEKDIWVIRPKTSTIKKDILLAAEGAKVNQDKLQTMLIIAKHINSNDVQRSIHFHSFNRAKARKYELLSVPFRVAIYRLSNMHQADTGSVIGTPVGTRWGAHGDSSGVRCETSQCCSFHRH